MRVARTVALLPAIILAIAACSPAPTPRPTATATPASPPPTAAPSESAFARPSTSGGAAGADVALEVVATGLSTPIAVVAPPDGSGRLFVVQQTGRISILRDGAIGAEPFLDIADRLVDLSEQYDERGLLGLAFHPDFASNGRLFVYYGAPPRAGAAEPVDHTNTLSEFVLDPADPDRADPGSERFVLRFEQPQPNHSGGALGFGHDGYLYLGTGDGGGTGDDDEGHSPQGNAQDRTKLNGKLLRLDVDGPGSSEQLYAIPPDNPFANGGGRPEIFAWGFRNPWRLSFSEGQSPVVSDVGYGRYEEIDVVELGFNYGWPIREGAHCLDREAPLVEVAECPLADDAGTPLTDPALEYSHRAVGIAVVGGYQYRGSALPGLLNRYVFADYSREFANDTDGHGTLLVADPATDPGPFWHWERLDVAPLVGITAGRSGSPAGELDVFVTGMGEDAHGELYVLVRREFGPVGQSGQVLKLVAPPG